MGRRVCEGALIGAACIIPGASGGVMALSMGLYAPCVEAVYGFFRHFRSEGKRHFLFLLPLGLGGVLGLLLMSFLLEWLLANWREPFLFLFCGMVAGGVPSLLREANAAEGFRPRRLGLTALGALLLGALAFAQSRVTGGAGLALTPLTAMLGGAVIAAGMLLPGMSTSFLLMVLGIYDALLHALTGFDMAILFFTGLGGLVGGGLMLLLVRRLLRRYYAAACYTMLGFLLASLWMVFPGLSPHLFAADILLAAAGFLLMSLTAKREKKRL